MKNSLEFKVLSIAGIVVALSFILAFTFNAYTEIKSLQIESIEKSRLIGDIITRSVRTIMLTGNAEIADRWTEDLRMVTRLKGLYIIKRDGMLAFRDDETIRKVNAELGKELFHRVANKKVRIMSADDERLLKVIGDEKMLEHVINGGKESTFIQLRPIFSGIKCRKCHVDGDDILGVLKIATSMKKVDSGKKRIILFAVGGAFTAILLVVILLWFLLRIFVTRPISKVADTIRDIIESDQVDKVVAYKSRDEIGSMVENFNVMTKRLHGLHMTLEEKVRKRSQQLLQAEKLASSSQLATGLIHEIRNPLSGMKLSMQLLESEVDQAFLEDVQQVSREIHRIETLLNHLLRFAMPHPPIFSSININDVVKHTLSLARRKAEKYHVLIETELEQSIPTVNADSDLMQQVFLNLILNAINAMPDGGRLTISSAGLADSVEIRFADTGHGISEDYMSKIFDPFFTTRGSSGGTGLGLSISYRIIKEHKGDITVESEHGRGTIFTVRLNRYKA